MKRLILALAALSALTACVSQNEMALSNNVYKIDVDARGLIGVGVARSSMQQRIAQSTIDKGYTHYLIQQAGSQRGTEYAGNMPVYGQTNVDFSGNTATANSTFYGGQPIRVPTSSTSVIVAMFKAPNIPSNAIDAAQVLKSAKK